MEAQAIDCLCRLGQVKPVNIYRYYVHGTLETNEGIRINHAQGPRPSLHTTALASTSTRRPVKQKKDSPSVNPASLLTKVPVSASSDIPSTPATINSGTDPERATTFSLANPVLAITPTTPTATPGETTFDKISQTISPAEVFKPVESPSAQLPQGVLQISQDTSPPDKNHGMLIAYTIFLINVDFVKAMLPTACWRLNTIAMYSCQPLEEDHQSSENQPNGSSANLQAPNGQSNSTRTTSSVPPPPPPPNDSTSQPTASTDPLTNLTILKSRNARISVIKYPSAC
ncbi:hypothetical protein PGTUg99_025887 [Puccinia graminis f. sp. tritici]|uniref:Uncharacterized protein n=1 Tax=Puccinia graminis f. sp. tritici TaxID=56615 RepID=A0A5B0PNN0_PUCGR|nr:hypothetical protein PGTUg99_025887 [Puccinia graminis f. sp. tritici]